jgi:hypothetical protein
VRSSAANLQTELKRVGCDPGRSSSQCSRQGDS